MAFGSIMKFKVVDLCVELAPFDRQEVAAFVLGMQNASVTQFLSGYQAQTLESEQQWYDKVLSEKNSYYWGVWVHEGDERKLIGSTSLTHISRNHTLQAISGCAITDKNYWGKGIITTAHKARTWFAFQHLGLTRIKSAVIQGNIASKKALEKCGYTLVYTERNDEFIDGVLRHKDNFECLNPMDLSWRLWWGDDRPTRKSVEARAKTKEVLRWAEINVELA